MPKIRASFCIFDVPLCLLDHVFWIGSWPPGYTEIPPKLRPKNRCGSMVYFTLWAYAANICFWHSFRYDPDSIRGIFMQKRAAIYVRVSTDKQTIENQVTVLRQIAQRRGWEVVEQYSDAGISGSKGRDGRPGLDQMVNDAQRRKFDVIMSWAI